MNSKASAATLFQKRASGGSVSQTPEGWGNLSPRPQTPPPRVSTQAWMSLFSAQPGVPAGSRNPGRGDPCCGPPGHAEPPAHAGGQGAARPREEGTPTARL